MLTGKGKGAPKSLANKECDYKKKVFDTLIMSVKTFDDFK